MAKQVQTGTLEPKQFVAEHVVTEHVVTEHVVTEHVVTEHVVTEHVVWVRLPPIECAANYRGHTMGRAKAIRAYKQACALEYRRVRLPTMRGPVTIHLEYYLCRKLDPKRYFPMDQANGIIAAKVPQDALVACGIIPNDTQKHVSQGRCLLHTSAPGHCHTAGLKIIIEEHYEQEDTRSRDNVAAPDRRGPRTQSAETIKAQFPKPARVATIKARKTGRSACAGNWQSGAGRGGSSRQ